MRNACWDGEPLGNRPPACISNQLAPAGYCLLPSVPIQAQCECSRRSPAVEAPIFPFEHQDIPQHPDTQPWCCRHNEHPHRAQGLLTSPEQRSEARFQQQHSHDGVFVIRARIPSRLLNKKRIHPPRDGDASEWKTPCF